MEIVIYLLVFFATLFILILVHEYGHFWTACRLKIPVERFSIGFGKPFFIHKSKKGIEYAIAPILMGGYVKLNEEEYQKSVVWKKMLVMLAGVTANMILAVIIFWAGFSIGFKTPKPIIGKVIPNSIAYHSGLHSGEKIKTIDGKEVHSWQNAAMAIMSKIGNKGILKINDYKLNIDSWKIDELNPDPIEGLGIKPYRPYIPPIINKVKSGSPAQKMGLKKYDKILTINNKSIKSWNDFIEITQKITNQKIVIKILRNGNEKTFTGKAGFLGILSVPIEWPENMMIKRQYNVFVSLLESFKQSWSLLSFNFVVLGKIITGKISLHVLGGPITIFTATGKAFQQGIFVYFAFLALLSIMLVFVNILPIPSLDGGNFLLLLIEGIIRKPIPEKIQFFILRIGMAVLFAIIFIAIGNDLMRLI